MFRHKIHCAAVAVFVGLTVACDSTQPIAPRGTSRQVTFPPSTVYIRGITLLDLGAIASGFNGLGGASTAYDVNDSGQVVGWTTLPGMRLGKLQEPPTNIPFVWSPSGGMNTSIPTCCGNSVATGINDSGVVVGTTYPTSGNAFAWIWRHGALTTLAPLYPNESGAVAVTSTISKNGRIVGTSWGNDPTYDRNGVTWMDGNPGVAVPVLTLPDSTTGQTIPSVTGTGIDDNGEALGDEMDFMIRAWLVDMSGNVTTGTVSYQGWSADVSGYQAVNTSHNVVGWTQLQQQTTVPAQAFMLNLNSGQLTLLGSLLGPGGANPVGSSWAYGINESNWVVGVSDYVTTQAHINQAFIWNTAVGMVSLGSLGGANPTPSGASAINHDMQGNRIYVAGWSTNSAGNTHAVLWTVLIGYRPV